MKLDQWNTLPASDAERELLKCCGSTAWANQVVQQRPFKSSEDLVSAAAATWFSLGASDWLEAFRSHPKIGEQKAQETKAPQEWSQQEQGGMRRAAAETVTELATLNGEYEQKFGFIFIICATGKSPDEMLANLKGRLNNSLDDELKNAAREQSKITELRIHKLLTP